MVTPHEPPQGERDLLHLIAHRVKTTPNASYGSMPIDETDLTKGFKEISWSAFDNAVNHAIAWLRRVLPAQIDPHETVGYTGPRDIRYPIFIVAVAKLERKLLVPGPALTVAAQKRLVEATRCKVWLFGAPFEAVIRDVARAVDAWEVKVVEAPDVSALLTDVRAPVCAWDKTWEQSKETPCLVVHTSGTTGFPKPVVYTHQALAAADSFALMPEYDAAGDSLENFAPGARWYTPLPALHIGGVTLCLIWPACFGSTIVFGPSSGSTPSAVSLTVAALDHGACTAAIFPPAYLDELTCHPSGLGALKKLTHLHHGGAPSRPATLHSLASAGIRPRTAIASTEAGQWLLTDEFTAPDGTYLSLRPSYGMVFEPRADALHEMVQIRDPRLARWQVSFMNFPALSRFATGDLWTESTSRPGFWKLVGRADDLVVLASSTKLHAGHVEGLIGAVPGVAGVVVGGNGRPRPWVLVEWRDEVEGEVGAEEKMGVFWPEVERVNETLAPSVQLRRELVLFATLEKPLVRNLKSAVVRGRSEELYRAEIEELYAGWCRKD